MNMIRYVRTLFIYYISKLKDFWRGIMNAVVIAVLLMLVLSLLRVNIVIALIIGALAGGNRRTRSG